MQEVPAKSPEQQWMDWASSQRFRRRYRQRAVQAALSSLNAGATPEQAALAGRNVAWEAEHAEWATGALVFGLLAAVVAVLTGGLAVGFAVLAIIGAINGFKSRTRQWQAIVGIVLAGLAIVIFVPTRLLR